jgi:hypothetical protein
MNMENHGGIMSIRALRQFYQQSQLAENEEELGEGNDEYGLRNVFVHT